MSWKSIKNRARNLLALFDYKYFILRHHYEVMTSRETIEKIISEKISVARYGDGEFKWMLGIEQRSFQNYDKKMSKRLREIIKTDSSRCLVCVPRIFSGDDYYSASAKKFWHNFIRWHGRDVAPLLSNDRAYGDAYFTRWYRGKKLDSDEYDASLALIKKIWDGRDVVIVEGELTRFGVGNDLLDNAKNVKRIIAPSDSAFSHYNEILRCVGGNYNGELVLAALGPTATVLAYDLSNKGIQTIDVGHLDVEYEWYLRGAYEDKIRIPGKYVNEAGGIDEEILDEKVLKKYNSQIVAMVGVKS